MAKKKVTEAPEYGSYWTVGETKLATTKSQNLQVVSRRRSSCNRTSWVHWSYWNRAGNEAAPTVEIPEFEGGVNGDEAAVVVPIARAHEKRTKTRCA